MKSTSDQLVAIVNGAGSPQEKRPRLHEVIESTVDVDDIARFCLGRFWRLATPSQQKQYMGLFHDLLVTQTTGKRPNNPTNLVTRGTSGLGCQHVQ